MVANIMFYRWNNKNFGTTLNPVKLEEEGEEEEEEKKKEEKLALFMRRIINFQQMIRCKGVLFRKDWKIINRILVWGLQEDGPG